MRHYAVFAFSNNTKEPSLMCTKEPSLMCTYYLEGV